MSSPKKNIPVKEKKIVKAKPRVRKKPVQKSSIGNEWWKLRAKHGRDTLFETPQLLWEAACEYFQWVQKNPLIAIDFKGKNAKRVEMPKMRPYTLHGLCIYLDCSTSYFREFKRRMKDEAVKINPGFLTVITRIEEVIYSQQFEGAASGFLNPNIIARALGLAEKIQTNNENKRPIFGDNPLDEL